MDEFYRARSRLGTAALQVKKYPDDEVLQHRLADARRDYEFLRLKQRLQQLDGVRFTDAQRTELEGLL